MTMLFLYRTLQYQLRSNNTYIRHNIYSINFKESMPNRYVRHADVYLAEEFGCLRRLRTT